MSCLSRNKSPHPVYRSLPLKSLLSFCLLTSDQKTRLSWSPYPDSGSRFLHFHSASEAPTCHQGLLDKERFRFFGMVRPEPLHHWKQLICGFSCSWLRHMNVTKSIAKEVQGLRYPHWRWSFLRPKKRHSALKGHDTQNIIIVYTPLIALDPYWWNTFKHCQRHNRPRLLSLKLEFL